MAGNVQQYALQWLQKRGYGLPQAAAMVGHGVQESGLNPNATGDNGTAYGAFQWRGPRLAGLYSFARETGQDPANLDTQLGYMDRELRTTEKGAGDALFGATNVRDAVRAGMAFERPQGYTTANPEAGHGWANRYGVAAGLAGETPVAGPAPIAAAMQPAVLPAEPVGLAAAFVQPPAEDEFTRRQAVAAAEAQQRRQALLGGSGLAQLYG
ncbi:phage tail tip lysozyme [Bradyrhizobium sp. 33ap4]|uniref:phage tail tip lysozyme n=1 Tax=Bradyrhizobium sp. 33ap4 TaxID=3061630 RepID=UPI00292E409F|nr:phage tail tip lysozyme [Bradyrhizobium sp. 33ap4]